MAMSTSTGTARGRDTVTAMTLVVVSTTMNPRPG